MSSSGIVCHGMYCSAAGGAAGAAAGLAPARLPRTFDLEFVFDFAFVREIDFELRFDFGISFVGSVFQLLPIKTLPVSGYPARLLLLESYERLCIRDFQKWRPHSAQNRIRSPPSSGSSPPRMSSPACRVR